MIQKKINSVPQDSFYIVGIGASAGGQHALEDFFTAIPEGFPMAFIVVTHLTRSYYSRLTEVIARFTSMPVQRIHDSMQVHPGHVYVMPENVNLQIQHAVLHTRERPKEEIINTTIDKFFASLAEDQQEKAIGVVLSGLGTDGTYGAQVIYQNTGRVMVQDPESTPFRNMPQSVIEEDHPVSVLSPKELAMALRKLLD